MGFNFAKKEKNNELIDGSWKVLIVDDDEEIHNVTKLALKKFIFENKNIEFFDAYSGEGAIKALENNPDIDLVLLDVVMDSDDDGLQTVKRIRDELKNKNVRIVLRTGQPGSAPEKEVILNYDIDDYKEKTELTSTKLFTTVVSALRTSRHLKDIEKNKEGLAQIIESSKSIFRLSSLLNLTEGVLKQLGTILNLTQTSIYEYNDEISTAEGDCFFATLKNNNFETLSTSGKFKYSEDLNIITAESIRYLNKAYVEKKSFFEDDVYVGFFHSDELDRLIFLYIEGCKNLDANDRKFLEVFSNNISIAFENICLIDKDKQKDMLLSHQSRLATMGEMIDNIAHQWRQPLSLITTNASGMKMMKEHNQLEDEAFYKHCDSIIDTSHYLSHTIEDFRNYFKTDKLKSYFKIKDVVEKSIFLLSAKIGHSNIVVKDELLNIEILGLQNEFIQVILNILNNAIDALAEIKDEKLILIEAQLNEEYFILTIRDNAGGIPKEHMNNIFEQYFTTKEEEKGSGLGLHMVKHIIENHMNGSITVENRSFEYEGKPYFGACFKVELKLD